MLHFVYYKWKVHIDITFPNSSTKNYKWKIHIGITFGSDAQSFTYTCFSCLKCKNIINKKQKHHQANQINWKSFLLYKIVYKSNESGNQ